jgi:hypothetical protein
MKILYGAFLFLQFIYFIQFLLKNDANPLWSLPPPPIHISYSTLIQNYANPLWSLPLPPIHIPYSVLMQN